MHHHDISFVYGRYLYSRTSRSCSVYVTWATQGIVCDKRDEVTGSLPHFLSSLSPLSGSAGKLSFFLSLGSNPSFKTEWLLSAWLPERCLRCDQREGYGVEGHERRGAWNFNQGRGSGHREVKEMRSRLGLIASPFGIHCLWTKLSFMLPVTHSGEPSGRDISDNWGLV